MSNSIANQFLIAMPNLVGAPFEKSVIYVCQNDPQGSMGLIINYPIQPKFSDLLDQLEIKFSNIKAKIMHQHLFLGGPMQPEHGFILHETSKRKWDSSLEITKKISITTSKDILEAILTSEGPKKSFICLGYAGWGPGQLETEIIAGDWLTCQSSLEIIFTTPTKLRWQSALNSLGIKDAKQLTGYTGHA